MRLLSAPPLTKLPPISEPLLVIVPLSGTLFSWLIPNPALNLQAHFSWKPSLTPQRGFLCSCFSPAEEDHPEKLSCSAVSCALWAVSSLPLEMLESRLLGCQRPGDGSLG